VSGSSKFEGFPAMVNEGDWKMMAAFIDGEGCIRIQRQEPGSRGANHRAKSPRHDLIIVIGNTDPRLAMWCKERFGGSLYLRETSKRNSKHRDAYVWHATQKRAESVLRGCLPHFILKREQAEIALAFCAVAWTQLGGEQLPQSVINQRDYLKQKLEAEKVRRFGVIEGFKKPA
jgi:hypothetical protein